MSNNNSELTETETNSNDRDHSSSNSSTPSGILSPLQRTPTKNVSHLGLYATNLINISVYND